MLYDQDMPHYLGIEACSMIIYIHKRVPHKAFVKMTPKVAFTRKKLDVIHFKIFGILAYCHILGDTLSNLDQNVERSYIIGYSETSKAY